MGREQAVALPGGHVACEQTLSWPYSPSRQCGAAAGDPPPADALAVPVTVPVTVTRYLAGVYPAGRLPDRTVVSYSVGGKVLQLMTSPADPNVPAPPGVEVGTMPPEFCNAEWN